MEFREYLIQEFGKNEPIFLDEINDRELLLTFRNYKEKLLRQGFVVKYDDDIYFVPEESSFGNSTLNLRKVYEKRYIENKFEVMGYYSGLKLLNMLGITSQVPNVIEITTNKISTDTMESVEGNIHLELRHPVDKITRENFRILQILEAMDTLLRLNYSLKQDEQIKQRIIIYVKENHLTKKELRRYIQYYEENLIKEVYESGIVHEFT